MIKKTTTKKLKKQNQLKDGERTHNDYWTDSESIQIYTIRQNGCNMYFRCISFKCTSWNEKVSSQSCSYSDMSKDP